MPFYIILPILAATCLSTGEINCKITLSEADIDKDELKTCECGFCYLIKNCYQQWNCGSDIKGMRNAIKIRHIVFHFPDFSARVKSHPHHNY